MDNFNEKGNEKEDNICLISESDEEENPAEDVLLTALRRVRRGKIKEVIVVGFAEDGTARKLWTTGCEDNIYNVIGFLEGVKETFVDIAKEQEKDVE